MITINIIAILKWYSIILILFGLIGTIIKDILYKEFGIATIIGTFTFIPVLIYVILK